MWLRITNRELKGIRLFMKKLKRLLHNVFITVGLGTMVFVPMLILDNGLNETLKSVLIWIGASILYGLSFELYW